MSPAISALLERIDERRRELGLSQAELLRRSGLASNFLKEFRNGRKKTMIHENALALAKALNWTLSQLYGERPRAVAETDDAEEGGPPRPRARAVSVLLPEARIGQAADGAELDFSAERMWPFSPRLLDELGVDANEAFVIEADGSFWLCTPPGIEESVFGLTILSRGGELIARRLDPPWRPHNEAAFVRVVDPSGRSPPDDVELSWLVRVGRPHLEIRRT